MNNTFKKWLHMFIFASAFALILAGCGSEEAENASTSEGTEEAAEGYPITIEHAFGETVIEEKPERVATISWGNHDVALALDVVPVGFSAANYGVQDDSGMLPWTAEKLEALEEENPNIYQDTDGLDFEAIADSNPDVILAAYSGITQEDYDTLSQIAPVVAYQETPWVTSWQDMVRYDSLAMGLGEEGEQLIKDTEKLITDKATAVPEIAGKKAAFVSMSAEDLSKFYIYTTGDPRGAFIEELGVEYPQNILDEAEKADSFYLELSKENADILNDVDIFVTYGNEDTLKALQADPLYGKVPAIERGSVVLIEDNTPLAAAGTPTPLSIEYTIDEYVSRVSDALAKVK
ncbi:MULTISPECIES: iron-siderophore ABC transporter substrate-binding protein [unclassified Exiguobacterium]|uniref:iron-siderophore ABC transporter substrate-binding protein n=1 Tax=unclassified Exiguobacterium TaxID=2644629 RepID=UPI00333B3F6E